MTKQTETTIKIRYWGDDAHHDPDVHDNWLDRELARVTTRIEEGNNQGDLVGPEGECGWWEIDTKYTDSEIREIPHVDLSQIDWEKESHVEGDPAAAMIAKLKIGPLHMHLHAVAVTETAKGKWKTVDPLYASVLKGIEKVNGEVKSQPVTINGRDYIVWALPFGT